MRLHDLKPRPGAKHRRKRLDSPLSVTEWARLMVFLGVDHPSGVKNLFNMMTTGTAGAQPADCRAVAGQHPAAAGTRGPGPGFA